MTLPSTKNSEQRKIILRADGDASIGLGHLYRSKSLMQMFESNYNCSLLTRSELSNTNIFSESDTIEFIPTEIDSSKEVKWIMDNFDPTNYIFILDGYHFDSAYQKKMHLLGGKIIYIDDKQSEHMYADVVINHSPGIKKNAYSTEPYTKIFTGTDYSILRPSFLKAATISREVGQIENIFICFGGADPLDLTLKYTEILVNLDLFEKINVLIGAKYTHDKIFTLQDSGSKLEIHRDLNENELFDLLGLNGVALVSSSTILYELCAFKTHVISGYYTDNQHNMYAGFKRENTFFSLGDLKTVDKEALIETFQKVINNPTERNTIIENQYQLFDGQSKSRITEIVRMLNS